MVLNNINNLIILTEDSLGSAAGNALLDGVKHGVKQFGRGLTDIVHLGKFNALDTAKTSVNSIRDRIKTEASTTKIKELRALSDEALKKWADHESEVEELRRAYNKKRPSRDDFRTQLQGIKDNMGMQNQNTDMYNTSKRLGQELNTLRQYRNDLIGSISVNNKDAKKIKEQLNLPTDKSGKLARAAGRATTGIAATGGTIAGINAGINTATNKLAASNNKEETK